MIGSWGNLRIVRIGPFTAIGFRTTFTRSPFSSLQSTIGEEVLTTRLDAPTICWITSSSFSGEENFPGYRVRLPAFSIKMLSGPFTMISVTSGSSSRSCRTSIRRIE